MLIHDPTIEKIKNRLEGRPCVFCGSLTYFVIVRYKANKKHGGLVIRCRTCAGLRGIVTEAYSVWVKSKSVSRGHA
ncbi:MAG: hypothetical protein ACE5NA_00805 [Nitrospiraceae bacterium]